MDKTNSGNLLQLLNYFFLFLHTGIIIFNLSGWIWKKTRKANLVLLTLTGLSWFVLGIFYGIGYCPFTDWHYQVLHKLGHKHLPNSYVEYLLELLTKADWNTTFINVVSVILYFSALFTSSYLNIRDARIARRTKGL